MKAHFEKVTDDRSVLHAFERAEPSFAFYWHYHPEFELTLILEGHGQRLIGNSIEDYGPGDLVLLGANLPHTYKSGPVNGLHRALVIQFRPELLGKPFLSLPEMRPLAKFLDEAEHGLSFSCLKDQVRLQVVNILRDLPDKSFSGRVVDLLQVLSVLSEQAERRSLSWGNIKPLSRIEDQERIDVICQFLCESYQEEIDYNRLSAKLHMNRASICRLFRKTTGRTMTSYVNEYRVSVAAQLLTQTSKSILEIAFEAGFGNYSHFNRQFQRSKGKTPHAFRNTFEHNRRAG